MKINNEKRHFPLVSLFFCSKKNKTIPFSQIYCNALELNACLFEVLSESFTFPNLYSLHMRHFSQFRGLLPYSQNTALKRKCKVSFVLCFELKILFEKKKKNTVGGMRNDPFGHSKTSNMFRLISKYLLLASQTNINIILQDFLWVWLNVCTAPHHTALGKIQYRTNGTYRILPSMFPIVAGWT